MPHFPFPTHIDSSMRAAFAACPRKFFFNYVQKRVLSEENIHLTFGGAMAKGLECFRLAFYRDHFSFTDALDLAQMEIAKYWIEKTSTPFEVDGSPKSLKSCLTAIEKYFQFFEPQEDYLKPYRYGDDGHAVEFTFAIPLKPEDGFPLHPETGLPILYTGRFDMLAATAGRALYIVDDKTCSQLGLTFSRSMKMRSQFTGYKWACDQFGLHTAGVVVRATCIQKTQMQFQELMEMRPDHVVGQWYEQLKADVWSMCNMWRLYEGYHQTEAMGNIQVWQPNLDDSCGSYGGCSYLDACLSPNPQHVIDTFYTDNHWDPLAKG